MKIVFAGFKGELPIIDSRLLPDTAAQAAKNVYLRHGTLKPEHDTAPIPGTPVVNGPSSIYRYAKGNSGLGYWMVWSGGKRVHAVKSILANDQWDRIYWTGDGAPKMGSISQVTAGAGPYPSASFMLGVPAPESAPVVITPGDRVEELSWPTTALMASYVVTCITRYGEESAPSMPSLPIIRWDMVGDAPQNGDVEVNLPGVPSGSHDIVAKRIYRAETSGIFQIVGEVPVAQGLFVDKVLSDSLGSSLPSSEWDMPDPRLSNLTEMPGGFLAGFFENTLCFSEAYYPHAWPVSYQLTFSDDIIGIAAVANGLVVATKGRPHLITGSSPAAMADMLLEEDQPCVSSRSVVDMGSYAIYASPEGLVAIGGAEAQVITATTISKDQWQALKPETIHAYRYENRYLGFYEGGSFSFTAADGFEFYDVTASGGYFDFDSHQLCVIQGNQINAWQKGPVMPMRWRSKIHEIPGASFTCGKVIAKGYPVTLRLFADGETALEMEVPSRNLFRLPAGYAGARDWEVEVAGTYEIQSIQISSSPTEIV